jgi:hypothetical protein
MLVVIGRLLGMRDPVDDPVKGPVDAVRCLGPWFGVSNITPMSRVTTAAQWK